MTQPAYELDLRDLLDAYYGPGAWLQRSMSPHSGSDIVPAVNAGLQTLRTQFHEGGVIKVPPGLWRMRSGFNPAVLSSVRFEGVHSMASKLVYDCASGSPFYYNGAGGINGGGLKGLSILLEDTLGDSNAYGVMLKGDATYQPDQMMFEDLYITSVSGGSYWWDGFHVDGSARVPPLAEGCRVLDLHNVQIFRCRNLGLYMARAIQVSMLNVGLYSGKTISGRTMRFGGRTNHVLGLACNYLHMDARNSIDVVVNGIRFS